MSFTFQAIILIILCLFITIVVFVISWSYGTTEGRIRSAIEEQKRVEKVLEKLAKEKEALEKWEKEKKLKEEAKKQRENQ